MGEGGCQPRQSLLPALMLPRAGRIGRGRVGHTWLEQEEIILVIQEAPTSAGSPRGLGQAAVKAVLTAGLPAQNMRAARTRKAKGPW